MLAICSQSENDHIYKQSPIIRNGTTDLRGSNIPSSMAVLREEMRELVCCWMVTVRPVWMCAMPM